MAGAAPQTFPSEFEAMLTAGGSPSVECRG